MTISKKTAAAVAKYGRQKCIDAARLNAEGEGASTIGIYLGLTTRQADAAINAGDELAKAAAARIQVTCTLAGVGQQVRFFRSAEAARKFARRVNRSRWFARIVGVA